MYRLPKDFDGAFLVGRTLDQICFNQNQISLHFDEDVQIVIEGAFSHQSIHSETNCWMIDVPVLESDLMQLLGHLISEATGDDLGTLKLIFSNGHSLRCFDNSPNYESYQIKHSGGVIIV